MTDFDLIPFPVRLYKYRRGDRFFDHKTKREYIIAYISSDEGCKLYSQGKAYYMHLFSSVHVIYQDEPKNVSQRRRSTAIKEGLRTCLDNAWRVIYKRRTEEWENSKEFLDLIVNEPDEDYL